MSDQHPEKQEKQEEQEKQETQEKQDTAEATAEGEAQGVAEEPESHPADPVQPDAALDEALSNVEKFRDLALRAEAEMQNVRRRAERDVENAHKYALERMLVSLFPVVDGLEKALESSQADDDPVIEGVRLTLKLLLEVLEKENVGVIDPVGEPFDPNEHEAMSLVENADMEPNSVLAVVQKGYKLNARVVRPAMVMVTKAPAGNADDAKP